MLYRISVTERGLTGIANIFRSRLSRLDDLLGAGTVPLSRHSCQNTAAVARQQTRSMLLHCVLGTHNSVTSSCPSAPGNHIVGRRTTLTLDLLRASETFCLLGQLKY